MGHDATYWLKWTAGNDVIGKASGVGRRGWNAVRVGVLNVGLEYILLPPLPLLHSDLVLGKNVFHRHGTPWTCSVVSVPTWMVFHSRRLSRLPMASTSTLPF